MFSSIVKLLLLAVVASLVAACTPAAPTAAPTKAPAAPTAPPAAATAAPAATKVAATATPAAKIKRGGTLVMGRTFTYNDMDPHRSQSSGPITTMLYDKLLEINPGEDPKTGARYQLAPMLAESWSVVEPKVVEFKLRKGVKFHDGSEWNADVAKWNLDRLRTDKKSINKELFAAIQSVDVVDPLTIRLKLEQPWGPIFLNLTSLQPGTSVASKAAVEKSGDEILSTKPVGSGPMVIDQWLRDDKVVMKKWDGYWKNGEDGKPLPYIDSFVERFIQDPSVIMVEMKAGSVQLAENIEAKDVAGLKINPDLVYWQLPWVSLLYFTYGLNADAEPFKDNPKVRYALQYALDREGMAKAMGFGLATPAYYWAWAPTTLGYSEDLPKYKFDLAKAKQMLAEAGYPNGIDIRLLTISRQPEQRIGELVKQMWDTAGIRTTMDVMERLTTIDRAKAGNFQVYFYGHRNYPEPDMSFRLVTCNAATNYTNYCNQELMKCMSEGRAAFDTKEREKVYQRCLRIIQEDALVGGGYFIPQNRVMQKSVKGLQVHWQETDVREVWLDR
ncbi:MAG: ABC transporter substrate-binding protein [Bacteroidetes bacterium]|nr:ABC transporter substrate-binding protein [Bacteroidota bacterium]MCL5026315.1 ABC transporter substrate-binding protein [Chloroflexota bacterium]